MTTSQQIDFDEQDRRIAEEARLRFPPPYVERASEEQGFYFHWRKLQYAFALPDPAKFPPVPGILVTKDQDAVSRYVRACKELSTYSLLNYGGAVTVKWTPEEESVEVDAPAKEALRGSAVLFRQIHSDSNEPASFKVVRSILSSASAKADDEHRDTRLDVVKQWSRAHAALLQRSLSNICQSKILEAHGAPTENLGIDSKYTPIQLISLFNYGDYIHWGDRRGEHAALFQDEVGGALAEFRFQEILIEMAHFYLGYAKLLETAFGEI